MIISRLDLRVEVDESSFRTDRFRFIAEAPYTDLHGRHCRGGHIGFLPLFRQGASLTAASTLFVCERQP